MDHVPRARVPADAGVAQGSDDHRDQGVFTDVTATVRGFTFVFGLGGIHGSVESEIVEASDSLVIESVDVTSMYPNIAISNGFYPEHLGPTFVTIYQHLYEERKKHPKGSPENAMLKLALNGCYGDSNNPYSVFYDSLFTMKVTLSGQMLICMLVDRLITVPTVWIIMTNTDGLEYTVHPDYAEQARARCREWEQLTKLNLEYARYKRMFIRDCNNYIGQYLDGKVKRKGVPTSTTLSGTRTTRPSWCPRWPRRCYSKAHRSARPWSSGLR